MCPLCALTQIKRWLARQKARILNADHFHVIFTHNQYPAVYFEIQSALITLRTWIETYRGFCQLVFYISKKLTRMGLDGILNSGCLLFIGQGRLPMCRE